MKIDVTKIGHREAFGTWLTNNGLVSHGAEIGCAFGGYANILLASWPGFLYMVDPFKKHDDYRESTNETAPFEQWFLGCEAIAKASGRAIVIRDFSVEGAKQINDNCLDFAFIDGNHRYTAVLADLNAWYPKVKSGGVLCGHDYGNQTMEQVPGWDCEVQRAVEDWLKDHPEMSYPHLTPCSSFWMLKP